MLESIQKFFMPKRMLPERTNLLRYAAHAGSGLMLVAGALVACARPGPPPPESGYRANVAVKTAGTADESSALERFVEFYYMGKRRRTARIDGRAVALIDRPDLRISWKLDPKAKTFEEHRISSLDALIDGVPNPFGPRSAANYEWLGSEIVEGSEVQKFTVEGDGLSGTAWLTSDRIPLRFEGTLRRGDSTIQLEVEYSEIERGTQAAFLFAIPPNYDGYENRKQKASDSVTSTEVEDVARRLREQQQQMPPPPPAVY